MFNIDKNILKYSMSFYKDNSIFLRRIEYALCKNLL